MLNKVVLMGRLTKDPETRSTPSQVNVTNFSLAVDRSFKSQNEERQTDFINIVCWRHTADFVQKYFTKGQLVAVSGRLQTRSWDDNEGKKRYATDVVADEVFFAEGKRDSSGNGGGNSTTDNADFSAIVDDDNLPF